MGRIYCYGLNDSECWDRLIRSFRDYDVYWLSGYVRAFQLHGDGEPLLYYCEDGDTRGVNVVMKRDIADDKHFQGKLERGKVFDYATPYGYGGWLIEGENTDALFEAYSERMKEEGIVCEFVRFHPIVKNHEACRSFYDVVQLGEVVHMDLQTPSAIWENLSSKNRNVIRKAIKNGVRVNNGRSPQIYRQFRAIYDETMDRDEAAPYYYFGEAFYRSLCEDLPQNAQVFYAEKDGVILAASVMLSVNGRMNYHLSGSLREYGSLAPTNLLLYEAALWGCTNGCKSLYLGGGVGSQADSLFRFKRAFYRGELNRFYIGKKVFNAAQYNELLRMREPVDSGFFPGYRA